MAYGLQIFDSAGNVTLDVSDRVAFFKANGTGTTTVTTTTNVDISVPGVKTTDYVFMLKGRAGSRNFNPSIPSDGTVRITISIGYYGITPNYGQVSYDWVVMGFGD